MKATRPARTWKDRCIDAALLTLVAASVLGLALLYMRK